MQGLMHLGAGQRHSNLVRINHRVEIFFCIGSMWLCVSVYVCMYVYSFVPLRVAEWGYAWLCCVGLCGAVWGCVERCIVGLLTKRWNWATTIAESKRKRAPGTISISSLYHAMRFVWDPYTTTDCSPVAVP